MLAIDEKLGQLYHRGAQAISQLCLQLSVPKQIQLVVFDHVRPQDLLHLLAIVKRFPHDTRSRRVHYHFTQFLLYVRLQPTM